MKRDLEELFAKFEKEYAESIKKTELRIKELGLIDDGDDSGAARESDFEKFLTGFLNSLYNNEVKGTAGKTWVDKKNLKKNPNRLDTIITFINAKFDEVGRGKNIVCFDDAKIIVETSSNLTKAKLITDSKKIINIMKSPTVVDELIASVNNWCDKLEIENRNTLQSVGMNRYINETYPLRVLIGLKGIKKKKKLYEAIYESYLLCDGHISLMPDVILLPGYVFVKTIGMPFELPVKSNEGFCYGALSEKDTLSYLLAMILYKLDIGYDKEIKNYFLGSQIDNLKPVASIVDLFGGIALDFSVDLKDVLDI